MRHIQDFKQAKYGISHSLVFETRSYNHWNKMANYLKSWNIKPDSQLLDWYHLIMIKDVNESTYPRWPWPPAPPMLSSLVSTWWRRGPSGPIWRSGKPAEERVVPSSEYKSFPPPQSSTSGEPRLCNPWPHCRLVAPPWKDSHILVTVDS